MADPGAPRTDARPDRMTIVWLFLAAFVVRLLYTILRDVGNPIPPGTDAISYDAFARAILSGTDWIANPGPELFRPPAYPMVLAFLYTITGHNLTLVQCLQSLVGAGSVVLVYELGYRHVGRLPALLAAAWLLVNPLHLDFTGKLLRETWLVALNVGLLLSLLSADGTRLRGLVRTALLFTILMHFDSRYLFHLPFFAVYFLIVARRNIPAAIHATAIFGAFVVLFSAPWAVRNAVAYDRFVLIDPRTLDRWAGRATTAVGDDAASAAPATALERFEAAKESALDRVTAEEREAYRAGVRPRSGAAAKALFNLAEFWRIAHFKSEYRPLPDGRFAGSWSVEHNVASLIFMGLLLPGFLVGTWRAVVQPDRVILLFLAFIAVHTLLHVLVHSVVRYRLPVEPFYALIAFRELTLWFGRRRPESPRPEKPVPVAAGLAP